MGVRPINNIVDITNYVMLEYGQPMHAFDYRYVKGGKIIVRRAEEGEELTTLDGNVRKLTANHLVIADEHPGRGPGRHHGRRLNTEIVADTTDVVFESACFDGTCIRKGALALGMRTEASAKFEKGLDPMNTLPAVQRACELVELLGAGEVVDGVIDILNYVPQPTAAAAGAGARSTRCWAPTSPQTEMCRHPGPSWASQVDGGDPGHACPSWRGDVEGMRRSGGGGGPVLRLQQHPHHPHAGPDHPGRLLPRRRSWNTGWASCAAACGYNEIITYSFISPT